jgi:hypothetical protein
LHKLEPSGRAHGFSSGAVNLNSRAERDNTPKKPATCAQPGDFIMRRFLLVAAASAIALVGLSANQCGGEKKEEQTQEQAPPAETTPPPEQPPAQ